MGEKHQDRGARSLSPEFWELELSADPAAEIPAAAEGADFSEGAPRYAADDPLEDHLDDGHILTQEVLVSQGVDTDHDTDQGESEPEQRQLAMQDPAGAGGRRRGRTRRRRKQFSFTEGQVQELVTAFQQSQYPDGLRR